jgi:predicted esterase
MECEQIRPFLAESLTGASTLPAEDHPDGCLSCRRHLDGLRRVEERLAELPRILPRFSETALRLELRPIPSRSGRTAAALAAAAAILMTLAFFLRPAPPPETAASRLAPRVRALVQAMIEAQGEAREALVLDLMNLGPDALPLLEPQIPKAPELADVVAVLEMAQETRVTVTSTSGETVSGALVTTAFKMKTGFGDTTIQVAKIVSIEFGPTDVVTTREKTQLKGKILLEDFKLKTDAGETTLKRANLASITVDGAGAKFEKGKIEDGTAKNGVTYHVRLPAKHDPKKPSPALVILHGSNMNSKTYLETLLQAWPRLGDSYVLIGINGEQKGKGGTDASPAYNYTYINFAGKSKYKGFPGTDRESPALVSEALKEIQLRVALSKVFVGGHSQGAFLTYSLIMNYPEQFAGAFPVSGGVIIQAEPTAYEKEDLRAAQRKLAIAIVHGENDEIVGFSQGKSTYESFLGDGFPMLRFFTHPTAAHMFAVLPVDAAIQWLEAMTSEDPAALVAFAEKQAAAKEWKDALAAADRAKQIDKGGKHTSKIKAVVGAADKEAAPKAKALAAAIASSKNDSWVADFDAFRSQFEFSDPAREVMAAYRKLHDEHEKPAETLFFSARGDFNSNKPDDGYKKCEELVAKYYASSYYRYAKVWLKNRK